MKKVLVLAMLCIASVCNASELQDVKVNVHHCKLQGNYRAVHYGEHRLLCPCSAEKVKGIYEMQNRMKRWFIVDEIFSQQEKQAKKLGINWKAEEFRPNKWWE